MIMGMCIGCSPYNAEQTVITQAIAVLRRFGTEAHVYLPGVGMLNGLQAANFIHSNGTEPGAVDQPVGLVLDAGGGLGVELFPAGNFGSGIAAVNYVARGTKELAGGGLRLTTTETVPPYGVVAAISLGSIVKNALITIKVTSVSKTNSVHGLGFYLSVGQNSGVSTTGVSTTAAGTYQFFVPSTALTYLTARSELGTPTIGDTWDIESISVREVTGITAQQPTTASKPILRRGAVNLLTYSGDFSNGVWSKSNVTPSGSQLTATSTAHSLLNSYAVTPLSQYTFAFMAKRGTMTDTKYSVYNATGAANIVAATSYYAQTNDATDSLVVVNFTAPAGCVLAYVYPLRDSGVTGTMFCTAAALFQGTYTAAQIQALGGIPLTTTSPASTALGAHFWQFDGVNDSLSLGGPLFQMADDHCVVAGAMVANTTNPSAIFSQASTTSAQPLSPLIRASAGGALNALWRDDAAGQSSLFSGTVVNGESFVVTVVKRGDVKSLQKNNDAIVTDTSPRGTTTLNSFGIGVLPQATPANYMNGSIYPIVAIKGTLSEADLLLIKKLVGQMSGVTIP